MTKLRTSQQLRFSPARCLLVLLAVGLVSPAFAREVKVPGPVLDANAAREFPQAIFDKISERITYQTTFEQLDPNGLIRWWPRTIKLVEFVKAPSQSYPDTYLYAMRYVVSVLSDKDSLAVYGTSCQVVVVYKDAKYDQPTVVCEPVNLGQPGAAS
jgi:hypothetical protein